MEVLQREGARRLLAARMRLDGRFRGLRLGLLQPRFLLSFVERSEKGTLGTVPVFEDALGLLRLRGVEGVQELVDAFFHVRQLLFQLPVLLQELFCFFFRHARFPPRFPYGGSIPHGDERSRRRRLPQDSRSVFFS